MRIGIHQPNMIPWLPFFYKMAMCDKFILLQNVQFEKGGFQNRYKLSSGKWVTRSVQHGLESLSTKKYADLKPLVGLNNEWIQVIKYTLNIETQICFDTDQLFTNPTEKLIHEIRQVQGDVYITNPDAKNKYLDEQWMKDCGIDIEYCKVPKHLQIHVFEAFEKWGIDGTVKQLEKAKCHQLSTL